MRLVLLTLLSGGLFGFPSPSAGAEQSTPELPRQHLAFLDNYCMECHDAATEKGEINLEDLPLQVTTLEQAELWQKVLNSMNAGEMPPEDKDQPGEAEKADFLDALAQTMVAARRSLSDSGGEITMRRLNRREYQNSMASLLGFKPDVSSLPADGGAGTFDTVGASQFISSDQIEQYLNIGRNAISEWLQRQATTDLKPKTFRVEPENTVNVESRKAIEALEQTQERYLLWKAEVDKIAFLPENEEALAKIREKYDLDESEDLTDHLRLYQNTGILKGAPDARKFGFRDGNQASFSNQGGYGRTHAYRKQYLEFPNSDRGTYLKLAWGIQRIDVLPDPKDVPPGTYKLRLRAGSVEGSDPSRHFIEVGHPQRVNQVPYGFTTKPIASLQVTGTEENPEIIETTVVINSDTPREFGIQERVPAGSKKNISREFYRYKAENGYGTPPAIWVDWVELEGPISNAMSAAPKAHRVEFEETVNVRNLEIIERLEDTYQEKWLPWKEGVDKAAKAAENQEIVAALRKKHPDYDSNPTLKYKKAELLKGAPDPRDYGGSDPINAVAALYSPYQRYHGYMKHYAELPHNDRGAYLKLSRGIQRFDVLPDPKDVPSGTYKLRIRAGAVEGSNPSRHFIEIGHPQRSNATSLGFTKLLSTQQISGTIQNPEIIEVKVDIGASTPREFGIQERQPKSAKLLREEFDRHKAENGYGTPPAIWVDWAELVGPIPDNPAIESTITRIEPEKTINPANEKEIANIEDAQARSAKWQKGVDAVVNTPANQAKIAEIRKTEPKINHPQWFYAFADRLEGTPDATDFGFRDAQKAAASDPKGDRANLAYHKHYASLPHRDRGTYLKLAHGTGRVIVAPEELPPGSYTLRVAAAAVEGSPASRHFIEVGHPQRLIESRNWGLEGQPISSHQVTGTIENPQVIEIPIEVGTDTIKEFAIQEKQPNTGNLKELWNDHNALKAENGYGHPPAIWIDWVELEGPHGAGPSEAAPDRDDAWFTSATDPDEATRARTIFEQFAFKAFRGVEAEDEFIDRLSAIYETRRAAGDLFDQALELPLAVILSSPGFLYFNEPNDADERRELNDRELAVRLAYFLWSAPPDQELLDLASRGELSNPDILRSQVDRLIADSRSDEFVAGFLHQWLHMERLDFFQFDTRLYRDFDESTRTAARQEVYHSFAHVLRDQEQGRLGKLLKSDYVFVNGLLATYYGLDGVTGDQFQKVALPAGSPRGGLLGMAAIHAMGSDGIESSPVERGAWVLRYLLNDPPPPAPPNVPQLSRLNDQPLTTREKLAAHMEEAQCASCHRKIDPIGFGLENFNAAGKWRTEEGHGKNAHPIDPADQFHNGPKFNDYFELRDIIADREPDFARGFTEHLIGYGLGRPFGFTDEDLANEIVAAAKKQDYTVSEFIQALVMSKPFGRK
jgi:hypothetical protein